ncbi:MAG: phosphate signaling complex protein PhoU [Candidatus Nitrohelix vancouverensis]|uniref:Phosphate-specific transport system accessory protein PhoU n=1 Tax=Candidatus Nitrohelix vancouverensis TaxID=2705534 RepID=A0A7T0G3D8_9BACT|nr:MAG: phosphate signaling complex protein PhoU [Candidatus Nitrohelix vancouverensis]
MARHPLHLEREITRLKDLILSLGTKVEENVQNSVKSLVERQTELAMKVIESDTEIDQMEVEVEEECLKILALYQPVANDLRFIVSILKINQDLERVGDLSSNVAERAVFLASKEDLPIPQEIHLMADKVKEMLKESLNAFVNADALMARNVCAKDDEVDDLNREMYVQMEEAMRRNPERISGYIHILSASRYLERIADHATNVAEDVIYLAEGEIIRHRTNMRGE